MDDEFNIVGEGDEFAPTVSGEGEGEEIAQDPPSLNADSAEETKDEGANGENAVSADPEGEKVSETSEEEEKTLSEVLASVDKEIADDKHPKWYKANLGAVKKAFLRETETLKSTYEPLADYGDVEEIKANLEIWKGLDSFENGEGGLPRSTVKPFVEKLVEAKGVEKGIELFNELAQLPSTFAAGQTIAHDLIRAIGLDPTRISDYKRFASSGYQLGKEEISEEELSLVPEDLREAFSSLPSDERDEMMILSESARERALKGIQMQLDSERAKQEEEKSAEAQKAQTELEERQAFFSSVQTRTEELLDTSGSRLFNSFTESLVSAEFDDIEAVETGITLSMILNTQGVEAQAARAAFEKKGIKIDPSLAETFQEWQKVAQNLAVFEKQGQEAQAKSLEKAFNDLETKLIRKANPIIAALIEYRTKKTTSTVEKKNERLTDIAKQNNGINGGKQEGISLGNVPITDFSDSAYLANEF